MSLEMHAELCDLRHFATVCFIVFSFWSLFALITKWYVIHDTLRI